MSTVTFAAIKSKVEELCTLPSTCPELKAVCMARSCWYGPSAGNEH